MIISRSARNKRYGMSDLISSWKHFWINKKRFNLSHCIGVALSVSEGFAKEISRNLTLAPRRTVRCKPSRFASLCRILLNLKTIALQHPRCHFSCILKCQMLLKCTSIYSCMHQKLMSLTKCHASQNSWIRDLI